MIEYFKELKSSGERLKVELNLSNYAKKADLINSTGVDTSKFAEKVSKILKIKYLILLT